MNKLNGETRLQLELGGTEGSEKTRQNLRDAYARLDISNEGSIMNKKGTTFLRGDRNGIPSLSRDGDGIMNRPHIA